MNNYGYMKDTVRRTAQYQDCKIVHAPGYGNHAYSVIVQENGKMESDVFWIKTEQDLNAALNTLTKRAME